MKFGKILAVAVVATVFASCSNEEELANVGKSESNAIRFAGISGLSDTRTTPIGTHNLTSTNFDVMAFMSSDNALFMGGKHVSGASDHGVKIVYNTSAWDYADKDQQAYWPTEGGDVDFYAVSPAMMNDLIPYFGYDMTSAAKTITYTTFDEYGSSSSTIANQDVMYAVAKGRNKTNNGTTPVQMKFKHILSQVVFKAKTTSSILEVDVQSVKIHNFAVGGKFTLPEEDPKMSDWTLSPLMGAYTVKLNAANVKTNDAVVDLSDMNSPMMMMPQQLTKWSTYSAGTAVPKHEADTKKECYLEISMKLKQNDSYLIGSATEYKTVYVSFDNGTGWEPGKRYIYTLIFGGGYDDQGEPILSPITFDAATTNWVDAAGTDVNIK
jgi:hypothetical protein